MKSDEEIKEILEAFDLTRSRRDAGELAGCSPNTVAHWVGARDAWAPDGTRPARPADRPVPGQGGGAGGGSKAKIRADIAHDKLADLGRQRGETVWTRRHGDDIVITTWERAGRSRSPATNAPRGATPATSTSPLHRTPRPPTTPEAAFLALGAGAALWLTVAGETGASRPRPKMAEAVALAALHGTATVDWAWATPR